MIVLCAPHQFLHGICKQLMGKVRVCVRVCRCACQLIGWLVGRLLMILHGACICKQLWPRRIGWLLDWLIGWLVGLSIGWPPWLAGWLAGCVPALGICCRPHPFTP